MHISHRSLQAPTCRPATARTPRRGNLGDDCTIAQCRSGLICDPTTHLCVGDERCPNLGAPCVIGVECMSGQCGPNGDKERVRRAAGVGAVGNRVPGRRRLRGAVAPRLRRPEPLSEMLWPAGSGDVGHACARRLRATARRGLYCVRGACAEVSLPGPAAPHGYPAVVPDPTLQWQGVSCPDEATSPGHRAVRAAARHGPDERASGTSFACRFPTRRGARADRRLARLPRWLPAPDPTPAFRVRRPRPLPSMCSRPRPVQQLTAMRRLSLRWAR